jgi:hypothetical protein
VCQLLLHSCSTWLRGSASCSSYPYSLVRTLSLLSMHEHPWSFCAFISFLSSFLDSKIWKAGDTSFEYSLLTEVPDTEQRIKNIPCSFHFLPRWRNKGHYSPTGYNQKWWGQCVKWEFENTGFQAVKDNGLEGANKKAESNDCPQLIN